MLTIPVASCSELVCANAGSTQASSASGEPPIQAAGYPNSSILAASSGVTERVGSHTPKRPRSGLSDTASVIEVSLRGWLRAVQSKRPRQFSQRRNQVFIFGEDLHGHMVG